MAGLCLALGSETPVRRKTGRTCVRDSAPVESFPRMKRQPFHRSSLLGALLLIPPVAGATPVSLNDLTGPWHLFVDDHPVEFKTNVVRRYHPFQKYPGNPVLRPTLPWEQGIVYLYGTVLREESGAGYRMWYHTLRTNPNVCREWDAQLYATSADGIHWTKPSLNLRTACGAATNNMYFTRTNGTGITSVIHTPWETDPEKRYKLMSFGPGGYWAAWSSNGIHIVDAPNNPVFTGGSDVGQFCWDPHTQRYLGYVKNAWFDTNGLKRRAVAFTATTNITVWPRESLILWPDAVDDRWSSNAIQRTHFYGLSAFPYETIYLGFLWIFRATNLAQGNPGYLIGPIYPELVSSPDGVHWTREEGDRPPILPLGPPGSWDDQMIFTARAPVVEGDTIKLWYAGFDQPHDYNYAITTAAIGLATLRKDGFASLDAGAATGVILTRLIAGASGTLRVNFQTTNSGWVRIEVLDPSGNVLPGYSQAECLPLTGNSTTQAVLWAAQSLLPTNPPALRFRFLLQNASVYSFMAGDAARIARPPEFTAQPESRTNYLGSTTWFTAQADGSPTPSLQWQKNGVNLADDARISGSTTATLTIHNVQPDDAGQYRCVAANAAGAATSAVATLTVTGGVCSVITNAGFEAGFQLAGGGYLAHGWTEWEAWPGVTIGYDETLIVHTGAHAQRIRVWGVTNAAAGGVFQQLPVTPGQPFSVSAWTFAGDAFSACSIGVHPAGGTNALDAAVMWSPPNTNAAWEMRAVSGVATGDRLTVFLRVQSADGDKRNGYFDTLGPAGDEPLRLTAERAGADLLLVWPECPAARLERADALAATTVWRAVTNPVVFGPGSKMIQIQPTGQAGFFRLARE